MAWTLSFISLLVFGSGLLALAVGLYALEKRPDPMAWPLAILLFAVAAWAIPHAVALGFSDVESVALWSRIQYPGVVLAPVAYLVIALRYANYGQWLSRRTYAALTAIPAVTTVVAWTNPVHGLLWDAALVVRVANASVLMPTYGVWYWVTLGYLYLVTAAGLFLFGKVIVDSGRLYRKQAGLMLVGALVPLATNVADTLAIGAETTIDLTTPALTVTGITFALALFQFDLTNVRPVARDRLLEELDDGVVVVGPEGRIRDYNPTAETILGEIRIDQDAEAVLPSDVTPDGGELVVESAAGERMFRTRSTRLRDRQGREAGRIVYLQDVTGIVEREQRISVLNRILRHNVRNELNVAAGHLETLEEEVSGDTREHVESAIESTDRVVAFAEKARHVQRTLTDSDRDIRVSTVAVVERVVTGARDRHPGAEVEVHPPADGESPARVVDRDLFELAVEELIKNAVIHSDRENPGVVVSIRRSGDEVAVSVVDDGPGIPEAEREVLTTGAETQLEHASGLGLWLVYWTASLSGGELSFDENEPRGSVVTLSLPAADRPL
ncbi:MAG: histidine kinase N-terminal 7TM domain-containing protein [Halobacteriales archaeon]